MKVWLHKVSRERQGGVTTYVANLLRHFSEDVQVVEAAPCDVVLHVGPHDYEIGGESWQALDEYGHNARQVVVVHDLIPEVLWGRNDIREGRKTAFSRADAVIAVSQWTKSDIVRQYGVPADKIHVVYHGVDHHVFDAKTSLSDSSHGKYILYIGKRDEYKRFRWLLRHIAPWMWRHPSWRLVCTGEPFCRREIAWLWLMGLRFRTTVKRYSEQELANLYAHAGFFVFPSVYEGFGIPLLEAMASGVPVVANRSSCLPEIAGDAAAFFEKDDGKSLRRVLDNCLSDGAFREGLIAKGCARAAEFSWRKCVLETEKVLKGR